MCCFQLRSLHYPYGANSGIVEITSNSTVSYKIWQFSQNFDTILYANFEFDIWLRSENWPPGLNIGEGNVTRVSEKLSWKVTKDIQIEIKKPRNLLVRHSQSYPDSFESVWSHTDLKLSAKDCDLKTKNACCSVQKA